MLVSFMMRLSDSQDMLAKALIVKRRILLGGLVGQTITATGARELMLGLVSDEELFLIQPGMPISGDVRRLLELSGHWR